MKTNYFITLAVLLVVFPFVEQAQAKYGRQLCGNGSAYDCVYIASGDTWEKLWPDPQQRELIRRINRTNLPLAPGMQIAVPSDYSSMDFMDHAPFAKQITPSGNKLIIFDPAILAWGAYDAEGKLVKWGPGAGGQDYCADVRRGCRTTPGTFTIYEKRGASCKSSIYPLDKPGAPMPHCMFFNGGIAFHGSPAVPGYHASHGCVRVYNEDAKWLNQEFIEVKGWKGSVGTKVIVLPYAESA